MGRCPYCSGPVTPSKQWRGCPKVYCNDNCACAASNMLRMYGITIAQYNELLILQGSKCAICETAHSYDPHKRLQVDHDHTTGRIRGLLCGNCNRFIGQARDDIGILRRGISYLGQDEQSDLGSYQYNPTMIAAISGQGSNPCL